MGGSLSNENHLKSVSPPSNVLELLNKFHDFGCQDPRDRICSLYGLINPHNHFETDLPFKSDYGATVRECHQNLASSLRKSKYSIQIFYEALKRPQQVSKPELSSWVPDWEVKPTYYGYIEDIKDWPWKIQCLKDSRTLEVALGDNLNSLSLTVSTGRLIFLEPSDDSVSAVRAFAQNFLDFIQSQVQSFYSEGHASFEPTSGLFA